jgi:hypothetical protein
MSARAAEWLARRRGPERSRRVAACRPPKSFKAIVCLLLAASYPAPAAVFGAGAGQAQCGRTRSQKECWPLTRGSSA